MGLNLKRITFRDWLESHLATGQRAVFLRALEQHMGQTLDVDELVVSDDSYPRIGSYTTYGVFVLCLRYLVEGDFAERLAADEDIEHEALAAFRNAFEPGTAEIRYAAHFLDVGDTDTIYVPVMFEQPFAFDGVSVGSIPAALTTLEDFARAVGFDLQEPEDEPEIVEGTWNPVATATAVARVLYEYFAAEPHACVAFA